MTDEPHGLDRGLTNYGDRDFARFLRRSFARSMGLSRRTLDKPIVGIAMTPSGFNNCHRTMPELVDAVTRGITEMGALARPFPTVSPGEVFLNPTSMMYRNLMAIDTEEMIGAQPMDAVVLIGGCDKTVPAQLMGAASAGLPAVQLVTGPMMTGRHKGQRLGACTDCRGFWAKYRANSIDSDEIETVEGRLSVTAGTCAVMGTASTMACIAEALGMSLPGTAAIPAVHADRLVAAAETGIPGREAEFKETVRRALDYAGTLGCGLVHLMAGIQPEGVPYDTAAALYAVNLAWAAERAHAAGVRLAIEAINGRDIPGYLLRTQEQAAALVAAVGAERVGLQFDIYHCQTAQGDVARRLEALMPVIAHIQVADVPGRNEPGTDEVGWEFLFGRIRALGYGGWIGCEYQPRDGTEAGLSWRGRFADGA